VSAAFINAREGEAAARDLNRSRSRIREATAFAAGCAVVAVVALPLAGEIAVAFGAGAVAGAFVAIIGVLSRQDKIARLALNPLAHELPEVSRYANRLTRHLDRERLADWIVEILVEAAYLPGNWYLTNRVVEYAEELTALSHDLADPYARIRPASAAACHLLLTQAVDSPLYNPAVPADQLPAIITNIRSGITRSAA